MEEIWKPVEGYEGLYEVSSRGNVRRIKASGERILRKNNVKKNGHVVIMLCKRNRHKEFTVAQLVAKAFVPKTGHRDRFARHKDGDPGNNRADNLEWARAPLTNKRVEMLKDGQVVRRYPSITEGARAVFRTFAALSACLNGKSKTCAGYQWRFVEETE